MPANVALRRTDGTRGSRFPFERGRQKRPAGETFHHSGIRAGSLGKTGRLRSDQENRHHPGKRAETAMRGRYLGSAALKRRHIRGCGFDGKAHLCAAKPLRGVVLNIGYHWESTARENESAIGHPGTALSGQCSTIGLDRRSDSARDSSERILSHCLINGLVSESQGYGRVVCLSMRKILEKLKSLCSWSGLPGIDRCLDRHCKGCFGTARFSP